MRILFVDNLLFEDKSGINEFELQIPTGLISLIAVAESDGHEGILYDPKIDVSRGDLLLDRHLYRRIADKLLQFEPDVVGLTSLGCNFICTVKVAACLKASRPDLPILLGGPHATVLDRPIIEKFKQFDVIVRNEAEMKLNHVLESLTGRTIDHIPGITFRRGGEIISNPGDPVVADLDALPWPGVTRSLPYSGTRAYFAPR